MRGRRAELLLVVGSLAFLALLAGAAELAVRGFAHIDLLGNDKHLFVANAYGRSHGNAPNISASSFGKIIYTDEHGFRVPQGGVPGDAAKREAILILGDSVGFGPAVEEPDTFAGRLRARFPDERIYNSSVIGYSTPDYRNVVDVFAAQHPEITAVVLVYCLNDVSAGSAANIERHLQEAQPTPAPPPAATDLTETLRGFRLLSDANDYLRSRSKLYLLIRHNLLRTQTRDWNAIAALYSDAYEADVARAADDIAAIAATLSQRGIPLVVVVAPFEHQLREPGDPLSSEPQRRLGDRLARLDVPFVDARSAFPPSRPADDYFLAYDSMHFSAEGHRVMADLIAEALGNR